MQRRRGVLPIDRFLVPQGGGRRPLRRSHRQVNEPHIPTPFRGNPSFLWNTRVRFDMTSARFLLPSGTERYLHVGNPQSLMAVVRIPFSSIIPSFVACNRYVLCCIGSYIAAVCGFLRFGTLTDYRATSYCKYSINLDLEAGSTEVSLPLHMTECCQSNDRG